MTKQRVGIVLWVVMLCIPVWFIAGALWGIPLHDFRLWRLKNNFKTDAPLYHPPESWLLQRKEYLGGPYDHGSLVCDYFVGELRSSPLSKEKIRQIYAGHFRVLFFDEDQWPMYLPLTLWWDEWYQNPLLATSSTVYFVYASQEGYPFLGDMRCDD